MFSRGAETATVLMTNVGKMIVTVRFDFGDATCPMDT